MISISLICNVSLSCLLQKMNRFGDLFQFKWNKQSNNGKSSSYQIHIHLGQRKRETYYVFKQIQFLTARLYKINTCHSDNWNSNKAIEMWQFHPLLFFSFNKCIKRWEVNILFQKPMFYHTVEYYFLLHVNCPFCVLDSLLGSY